MANIKLSDKLNSRAVLRKMKFIDPSLVMINCWIGKADRGDGDVVSNLPYFIGKSEIYKSIRSYIYWLRQFIPKCRVSVKNNFLNIYWDQSVLLRVLKEINES